MVFLRRSLALTLVLSAMASAQAPPVPEYRVKATFLFQFVQFVGWPSEVLPPGQTPLVIGILGQDPFGNYLDETLRNEKVNDHPLFVQRYRRLEDVKDCHVLFVSRSEAARLDEILGTLKKRNILTVGDIDNFADRGGIIQFVTRENRVRLKINLESAKAANLTISSKLLRPATVINSGAD